ncbi:MAG: citrate synthase [Actinomycetota bacterium]|nr:citrate synthase [Actinomycetota bacterium]
MTELIDHRPAAPPGLRGVEVTSTTVGDVRGHEGRYHYRQYDVIDLARTRSLEAVWHVLLVGHLPDPDEEAGFRRRLGDLRVDAAERLGDVLATPAAGPGPLDTLRTAMSQAGAVLGCRALYDLDPTERAEDLLRLVAATPVLVAGTWRTTRGEHPVAPDPTLGHAADLLRMIGDVAPGDEAVRAVEQYLVLTTDHGFNASTFTARVVASTGADAASCLVAALGALSGPLHGGAPARALELIDELAVLMPDDDAIDRAIRARLGRGERLMGFGHAVYRTDDPRSLLLRDIARTLGGPRIDAAERIEAGALAALADAHPERPLRTNVELYTAVVLERCGVPAGLFSPMFATARVAGWAAHVLEQAAQRTLFRPSARYEGPWPLVPLAHGAATDGEAATDTG